MDENMKLLLLRFLPYVEKSRTLDLVSSKFGIIKVENVALCGVDLVTTLIEDFDELARTVFCELESDISEEHDWRDMTEEDAAELRRRVLPFISDLNNADHAKQLLEEYISFMLGISCNAKPAF